AVLPLADVAVQVVHTVERRAGLAGRLAADRDRPSDVLQAVAGLPERLRIRAAEHVLLGAARRTGVEPLALRGAVEPAGGRGAATHRPAQTLAVVRAELVSVAPVDAAHGVVRVVDRIVVARSAVARLVRGVARTS